jgi:hypothetical protein
MTEFECLQKRCDEILATNEGELAASAWRALSAVLRDFSRRRKSVKRFPIQQRVNQTDVDFLLSDLTEAQNGVAAAPTPDTGRC